MKVTSAKILSSPDEQGWVQVHDFEPEERKKAEKRGRLLAVMAMKRTAGAEEGRAQAGREVLTRLHEEYFGEMEKSAFEALKGAVGRVGREFSGENGVVQIAAMAVVTEAAYLVCANGAKVVVLREGRLTPVLVSGNGETRAASGWLKDGDVFVLGTEPFFKVFPMGVIKGALANGVGELVEALAPTAHAQSEGGALGAVVVETRVWDRGSEQREAAWQGEGRGRGWRRARGALVGIIDRTLSLLPERRVTVRQEMVDIETKRRKRVTPLIGVVLLGLLGISIFFGVRQRRENLYRQRYESRLGEARHQFAEAQKLVDLNKARARELVIGAKTTVEELRAEGVEDAELEALEKEIADNLGRIAGIYEGEAKLYLDLTLIASGFKGEKLKMSDGRMLVLDIEGRRVVSVDLATKKTEVVGGPEYLKDAREIAVYAERNFALSSDGIRELGEEVELLIKPEWEPREVLIGAFAGNMYVLDKKESVIWRYPGVRLGFSEKQNWLGEGVKPNLSGAKAWAIDGAIWVLRDDGGVAKFALGSPQAFSLTKEEGTSAAFESIFTGEDCERLYLLDRQNARVMVFSKNGDYQEEYRSEKLGGARELVVSEEEGKMVFLAEDKLWEVGLGN